MAEQKQFKWQVKPGGTIPADSMGMSHAKSQLGATSQVGSLGINKGGEFAPGISNDSLSVAAATNAPKAACTVNAVDKVQSARHNTSGY